MEVTHRIPRTSIYFYFDYLNKKEREVIDFRWGGIPLFNVYKYFWKPKRLGVGHNRLWEIIHLDMFG